MAISLQRLHLKREFEGYLFMASPVYMHLILRLFLLIQVLRCVPSITTNCLKALMRRKSKPFFQALEELLKTQRLRLINLVPGTEMQGGLRI